jgi:hypothetical protein
MRTEDDLRAALTALERHAPAADRVLPSSERHSSHGLGSPRAIGWLAGITTVAALAGAVTALTLPGGTPGTTQNGGGTSPAPITKTALQAKLLAAFSATTDEIVYMHGTYQTKGVPHTDPNPLTEDVWYYPGQPSVGQRVRVRSITVQAPLMHLDVGVSYLQPAPKAGLPPGTVQTKGEQISVDYLAKTWSDVKNSQVLDQPPYNPALIASYFKSKQWTARNTTLNGRAAIELTLKDRVLRGQSTVNSWVEYLWVDASTYLPLHDVTTFGPPGMATHAVEDFQYLPATPANLAKLTPPIPAGFKQFRPAPVPAYASKAAPRPSAIPLPSNSPLPPASPSPAPSPS